MKLENSSIVQAISAATSQVQGKMTLIGREALSRVAVVGPIGSLVNAQAPDNLDDGAVHPFLMILEHARVSETQGAGSMRACVAYADRLLQGSTETPHRLLGRAFTCLDVLSVVKGVLDETDAEAMVDFIKHAGASRYVVERTPSRFDSVEFVDSYEFKHASKHIEGTVTMDGARLLVADGYVETVAEIHGILDRCSREGERLIICGRGFSDEVLHTIAVNRQRGTLIAYALTFPFSDDDANTLVDIATIVGGDVVSSLKGELFTSVSSDALPRVPYARLRGDVFDFRGQGSQARIASVLHGLQVKILDTEDRIRQILEKRLRRLSGACMIVRLADDINHLSRVEAWDLALRSLRAATRGVVNVDDQEAWPGRHVVPLSSVATAHKMACKLVKALRSLHSVV